MKLRLIASLIALVIVALAILGSAVYVSAHSNVYSPDNRGHRFGSFH